MDQVRSEGVQARRQRYHILGRMRAFKANFPTKAACACVALRWPQSSKTFSHDQTTQKKAAMPSIVSLSLPSSIHKSKGVRLPLELHMSPMFGHQLMNHHR